MLTRDSTRGVFVAVEGLDRCGKSTQAGMLRDALQARGFRVLALKLPDRSTATGAFIDRHLRGVERVPREHLQSLFVENRRETEPLVRESIASGMIVIADRYSHSGVAYGAATGLSPVECAAKEAGLPHPDLVVFVDVTPAVASERAGYGDEVYERTGFQMAVREEFYRMMDSSWCVVDGSRPAAEVHERIFERVINEIRDVDDTDRPLVSF